MSRSEIATGYAWSIIVDRSDLRLRFFHSWSFWHHWNLFLLFCTREYCTVSLPVTQWRTTCCIWRKKILAESFNMNFTCELPGETTTSLCQNVPTGPMNRKSTIFYCESLFRIFSFLMIWNESTLFRWFSWWIFSWYFEIKLKLQPFQ